MGVGAQGPRKAQTRLGVGGPTDHAITLSFYTTEPLYTSHHYLHL